MTDSKFKEEIEKLKNNANVDDGLKQIVLELQNEVVQFENRIKKIIEKANNKLLLSSPSQKNDSKSLFSLKVNNYDDIQDDDLWIPKELLSDEVKIPEVNLSSDNSNIDFLSLINKSNSLNEKEDIDINVIEPLEEKISINSITNNENIIQDINPFNINTNPVNLNKNRSIKVKTSNNKNFTISQIKQKENIQKINFAIEKNNESYRQNKKNNNQPLHTRIIKNFEEQNDNFSEFKSYSSKKSLNNELKEINFLLKRKNQEDVNKKRKLPSKTRIIKLNHNSFENNKNNNSFSKTIKISFSNNKDNSFSS